MHHRAAWLALVPIIFSVGCSPSEVAANKPTISVDPKALAIEARSEKATLNGLDAVRMTSIVDHFSITLPPEFRGAVLTEKEIDRFSSALSKASQNLSDQIRVQCNNLRPAGGALFALNVAPSSVTNGFADNMNVSIRGLKAAPTLENVKKEVSVELQNSSPKSKLTISELSFKGAKMLEFKIVGLEGTPVQKVDVTRIVYVCVRDSQVFSITYACATARAPKVASQFRGSALSLAFE